MPNCASAFLKVSPKLPVHLGSRGPQGLMCLAQRGGEAARAAIAPCPPPSGGVRTGGDLWFAEGSQCIALDCWRKVCWMRASRRHGGDAALCPRILTCCREWGWCLKPARNDSSTGYGERAAVGPWPLCCPQWSLCVRSLPSCCDHRSTAQVEGLGCIQAIQRPWAG